MKDLQIPFSSWAFFFLLLASSSILPLHGDTSALSHNANTVASSEPWTQPRELSHFQALLSHSPFSLATAEETSPLSERYAVAGFATIDGEDQLFVVDRTDQSREILTKKPNAKSMALINIIHDNNPNQIKATIRVGEDTGIISSQDPASSQGQQRPGYPLSRMMPPGMRSSMRPGSMSRYPYPSSYPRSRQPYPSSYPSSRPQQYLPPSSYYPNSGSPNNRRIIRRPLISPQRASTNLPYSSRQPLPYSSRQPLPYSSHQPSSYPSSPNF